MLAFHTNPGRRMATTCSEVNGFQFGFLPYKEQSPSRIAQRRAPLRLWAAYELAESHPALLPFTIA